MKTIFQLAKIARRAMKRKRLWTQKSKKSKTLSQRDFCLNQIRICEHNSRWVAGELDRRNVNGPAYRRTSHRNSNATA